MLAAIWATGLLTGLVNNAGRQVGLIDACGSWPPRATDHGHLASWHEVVS
jgi:hypothetical protein